MKKFLALLLIFNASFPEQEASAGEFDFSFEEFSFTYLTPPIRFEELNGAMIVELAKKRGFMPIIYPRRESLYHWLDYGNRDLLTLEQLIDDPLLFKKPKPLIKKNLFISQKIHEIAIEGPEDLLADQSDDPVDRAGGSEIRDLVVNPASVPRASDREFQAFLDNDEESLLPKHGDKPLARLVRQSHDLGRVELPFASSNLSGQAREKVPPLDREAQIYSDPRLLEEYERRVNASTLGRINSVKRNRQWIYSSSDRILPGNLKLKASKRMSDGKVLPAQASDFYLTTQDLRALLKDTDVGHALAGEVSSVAEIWAHAEKNLSTNPEIALSVKSILLQAKVGRARTNPFGEASLKDLPPDEKYYLIGIDKDQKTNVVTIWSKEVEVNSGDNVVELSSSDVIYQD